MRTIDPGLTAHLATGVTTLCRCWKLTRTDGVVLGFTDHDRALAFDALTYEPESGFDASEETSATGFAIGGMEVLGALSSDRLPADDLAAGVYDNAEVRVYLVNWTTPSERHLLRVGHLGEVTREDGVFRAEIRGLASALDEPQGRVFRHACDADLGDARCGVDLESADLRGEGAVTAATGRRRFIASGLTDFDAGWFERGRLMWTSGANAGRAIEVRAHRVLSGDVVLELWQPMHFDIADGDAFVVTAGCDKLFATCVAKFHNAANFRGFPHMPGNDFALSYARAGDVNDGGPVIP
ncbi:MAG TPA: DUF2163 domain-containing protein [Bauldia sp.]|nr:DUF2163 domain-containing protein [Bauldia sp.]